MANYPLEVLKKFPIEPHHEVVETFADQVGMVFFDGSTLRIEFAVARINEPKTHDPPSGERHVVCRLVLSTPCAIDLINQMRMIAAQLGKVGLAEMDTQQPTTKN